MNEIWKKNREKLLARMEMFSAAVLFAGKAPIKRGDENYPFSPDRNFYYVTGIEREDCILFLAKTRTGVEETLYIPRDNGVMAKWVGANMTAEEATEAAHRLSELSRTEEIRQFEEQVDGLFADGQEDEIAGMLAEWKDTYRKNCRI